MVELQSVEARLVDLYARTKAIIPATIDAKLAEARSELEDLV